MTKYRIAYNLGLLLILINISLILKKHTLIESITGLYSFVAASARWNDWKHLDFLTYGAEQAAACSEQIQPGLLKQYRRNIEPLNEDAEIWVYHSLYPHAHKHTLSTHDYCIFCIPFINTSSLWERSEFLFICKCFYTCFYRMKIANLINVAQIIWKKKIAAIVNWRVKYILGLSWIIVISIIVR